MPFRNFASQNRPESFFEDHQNKEKVKIATDEWGPIVQGIRSQLSKWQLFVPLVAAPGVLPGCGPDVPEPKAPKPKIVESSLGEAGEPSMIIEGVGARSLEQLRPIGSVDKHWIGETVNFNPEGLKKKDSYACSSYEVGREEKPDSDFTYKYSFAKESKNDGSLSFDTPAGLPVSLGTKIEATKGTVVLFNVEVQEVHVAEQDQLKKRALCCRLSGDCGTHLVDKLYVVERSIKRISSEKVGAKIKAGYAFQEAAITASTEEETEEENVERAISHISLHEIGPKFDRLAGLTVDTHPSSLECEPKKDLQTKLQVHAHASLPHENFGYQIQGHGVDKQFLGVESSSFSFKTENCSEVPVFSANFFYHIDGKKVYDTVKRDFNVHLSQKDPKFPVVKEPDDVPVHVTIPFDKGEIREDVTVAIPNWSGLTNPKLVGSPVVGSNYQIRTSTSNGSLHFNISVKRSFCSEGKLSIQVPFSVQQSIHGKSVEQRLTNFHFILSATCEPKPTPPPTPR